MIAFSEAGAPVTTATFSAAGHYVLKLTDGKDPDELPLAGKQTAPDGSMRFGPFRIGVPTDPWKRKANSTRNPEGDSS